MIDVLVDKVWFCGDFRISEFWDRIKAQRKFQVQQQDFKKKKQQKKEHFVGYLKNFFFAFLLSFEALNYIIVVVEAGNFVPHKQSYLWICW